MVEVWTHAAPAPHAIAAEARLAEAQGWDGLGVPDSQNRAGDCHMHGNVRGPASSQTEGTLKAMHGVYDMRMHTRGDARQARMLAPEFIDRFAVVGPPDRCVERLRELAGLGLDKLFLATNFTLRDERGLEAIALAAKEVLPALRAP